MKNFMLAGITLIIIILIAFLANYHYPRKVSFELVKEIDKPQLDFHRTDYIGFDYIRNVEQLYYYMIDYYNKESCVNTGLKGYNPFFVKNLAVEFDFSTYDYIITYEKMLRSLKYSLHLTNTKDGLCFDRRTPLIPIWDTVNTNKVYIYRIKKNSKFRAPGP